VSLRVGSGWVGAIVTILSLLDTTHAWHGLEFFFDVMAGLELHIIGPDVPSWGQATPDGGGDVRTAVSRRPEP
jgi:hypothetical protein